MNYQNFIKETFLKLSFTCLIQLILLFSICLLCLYLINMQLPSNNKTKTLYIKTEENEKIIKKLGNLIFKPTFYIPGFLEQIFFHEQYPRPSLKFKREYIKGEEGEIFSMDWVINTNSNKTDKLLIILHGLTGGSERGYIREIIESYLSEGDFTAVVIHNRGISDTPLITNIPFHSGFIKDMQFALNIIKSRYKLYFCAAIGLSMGANIFTQLIAYDHSFDDFIKCFISISNPLNLYESEKRIRGTWMDKHIQKGVRQFYESHKILRTNKCIFLYLL